ncbi:MAG: glucose-1-phosphate thymidylyltransferase RfbA [Magnetococcales bacterium]|nr:glucose-1-phosphate thymidylyltransferase RfbA [Magnetococcales bacterium]
MGTRKGIILAGGSGTRLYPVTLGVSKQLVPVYDKPMIYYPLSVLLLAGIRDILVITTPDDQPSFRRLLGNGSQWGITISYEVQVSPQGIAQAFILGRRFIGGQPVALILGDNLFFGHGLTKYLRQAAAFTKGATVFGYHVRDPQRYGVVEFDSSDQVVSLEEKPVKPRSSFAVTGLYFYDENVCDFADGLKPSERGELEITDLNKIYLNNGTLRVQKLYRGITWLDTGTHETLLQAGNYIQAIQERQMLMVACIEEIAFRQGYISAEDVARLAGPLCENEYKRYLLQLIGQLQPPATP